MRNMARGCHTPPSWACAAVDPQGSVVEGWWWAMVFLESAADDGPTSQSVGCARFSITRPIFHRAETPRTC